MTLNWQLTWLPWCALWSAEAPAGRAEIYVLPQQVGLQLIFAGEGPAAPSGYYYTVDEAKRAAEILLARQAERSA